MLSGFVTDPNDLSEGILVGEGQDLWRSFLLSLETFFYLLPFKADVSVVIFYYRKRKGRKTKTRARVCFGSLSKQQSNSAEVIE